jgi:hypothetical protein
MNRIYAHAYKLKRLRGLIESGVFAVPELQREFVWNTRKACTLLDSIYRTYPIGTILIWKTGLRNESQLRKQHHILPHFDPANRHRQIYFLIDGQQRLSVLWHFLCGRADSIVNADGQRVDFGGVYFDPGPGGRDHRFVYRARVTGELARRLVPVVDILSAGWRTRMRDKSGRDLARITECRRRLHDYEALLVFCETNDRSEVREAFVRINSLGMQIGAADRAFARASKFNMRSLVREAQVKLNSGFNRVRRTTILQTIALALGGRDLGERAIDAMVTKLENSESERVKFIRSWRTLREAFAVAVDFLVYELGVVDFDFLPSEPMLVVLTLFFFHNGNARPAAAAKSRLRVWFWATAVGARYTGSGYRPNLLADAAFAVRLASSSKAHGPPYVRVQIHRLNDTVYSRPGPISNGFFCLLRLNRPRYIEDGTELPLGDISSRRNRRDKHHIVPRALLSKHGIGAHRFNSILNICYLVARENQSIGQRAPRLYLSDIPQNQRTSKLALKSHLIPSEAGQGIWDRSVKRGFRTFLESRRWMLARAFESQAGVKLFER